MASAARSGARLLRPPPARPCNPPALPCLGPLALTGVPLPCARQGYTLFASAFIAGPLTGAALNPARVFGPALIYNCYW